MPSFSYLVRDMRGIASSGTLVANSAGDAASMLRNEGKIVVRVTPEAPAAAVVPGSRRVKTEEVINFANQLAVMVETGVSLVEAIETFVAQTPPGAFRAVLEDVAEGLQSGNEFSAALARHPKVFSPMFVNMVRAGESSGKMGAMLVRTAHYLQNQRDTVKRIRGALLYPLVMLVMAIGVVIFLITWVLPKFAGIYKGKEAVLPTPTRILMGTSDWVIGHWIVLAGAVLIVIGGSAWYCRTPGGRIALHWLMLNAPLFGPLFRKAAITRSLRTLGTMIDSGVEVLESIGITRNVCGNHYYEQLWEHVDAELQQGRQLSEPLFKTPLMPGTVTRMIAAGERTGRLGPVMQRIADFAEEELKETIKTVTGFIEPAIICVLGLLIGGIAMALLLPIFTISKVMTS